MICFSLLYALVNPSNTVSLLSPYRRPIIQSNFRTKSPAYPLLHIDAFNDSLAKAKSKRGEIDPVLYVASHHGKSACCHIESGGVRILCPVSVDGAHNIDFRLL